MDERSEDILPDRWQTDRFSAHPLRLPSGESIYSALLSHRSPGMSVADDGLVSTKADLRLRLFFLHRLHFADSGRCLCCGLRLLLLFSFLRYIFLGGFVQCLGSILADTFDIENFFQFAVGHFFGGLESGLVKQLDDQVVNAGNSPDRLACPARLFFSLSFTPHIDPPAGQARSQAHILTLLTNGERQLIIGNNDLHAVLVVIDDNLGDFRRSQGTTHIFGLIGYPMNDINLLTAQLLNHRLNPSSLHPHACPDRIHVGITGDHRHLRPTSALTRRSFDFHDSFVDFRNLLLKKFDEHAGMGARKYNLRPPTRDLHANDVGSDSIPLAVAFPRYLFLFRENGIGASQVDVNVALLEALQNAIDQSSFTPFTFVIDIILIGIQ